MHYIKAGDHIVTIKNVYGPANNFMGQYLEEKCGVTVTYVKGCALSDFENALTDKTSLIYLESPASMTFELQDISAVANLAKAKGIKTIIDNTWASPLYQQPLNMGIDMEVHSVSKYLGGHSDIVSGVLIGKKEDVDQIIVNEHALLGGKMAPFEAWLVLRSLRTLPLRMKQHQTSAMEVVSFLEAHPKVRVVNFPGLPSHPQYELAKRQMSGYGGLLSFELKTENVDDVKAFVNSLSLFKLGVSWGGHESLIYSPSISYIKELSPEKFKAMGIKIGLLRLSIGLEDVKDLISDLENSFQLIV